MIMILSHYISHVERSAAQNFKPLTKPQFFAMALRINSGRQSVRRRAV